MSRGPGAEATMTDPTALHRALADPRRAELVTALEEALGALDASELGRRVGLHANTVRWHLGILEDAGVVTSHAERRDTPGRPRRVWERAPDGVRDAEDAHSALAEALVSVVAGLPDGRGRRRGGGSRVGHARGRRGRRRGDGRGRRRCARPPPGRARLRATPRRARGQHAPVPLRRPRPPEPRRSCAGCTGASSRACSTASARRSRSTSSRCSPSRACAFSVCGAGEPGRPTGRRAPPNASAIRRAGCGDPGRCRAST